MSNEGERAGAGKPTQRFLGSLRDALAAAGREDPTVSKPAIVLAAGAPLQSLPPPLPAGAEPIALLSNPDRGDKPGAPAGSGPSSDRAALAEGTDAASHALSSPSAAEAARAARGGTPNIPPTNRHVEFDAPPTTRVVRNAKPAEDDDAPARTRLVRGRQKVKRQQFQQDPVVGWLVIVGGPGLGTFRPIFEGNNTVGRSPTQRIPIDFGDDSISAEEQAFIRYDSADRTFLFVPNLTKTNVVAVNDKRPTAAVTLQPMDVIMMGGTQLVFVPFCGPDFDWSEISDNQE